MPITVVVRAAVPTSGEVARLTFDGTQRVIIGRGPGSEVRLPDLSVSHRHASLRAQGGEFVIVDEGSTNGTFVGDVRVAARTSRVVRSGDLVRLGRIWLELRVDQNPVTRDVASATRDLALGLVSQMMAAVGTDPTPSVRVVEGPEQERSLRLIEDGRPYLIGRAAHCDLVLTDADASREHVQVTPRGGAIFVRALGPKNGAFLGESRVPDDREVPWRPAIALRLGRTVLALDEPVGRALADLERAADEAMRPGDEPPLPASPESEPAPAAAPGAEGAGEPPAAETGRAAPSVRTVSGAPQRMRWSLPDMLVMIAAVSVLALSLAGLVWLFRG
jgi:pSer/pThr/pTyr-binding forkhead associated (FHA) protein